MNKTSALFIIILILATLFSYLNSLQNQFIWDDEDFILKNSTIRNWRNWPALFFQNTIHGARKGSNFYRPIQGMSHGVDYLLWKHKLPGHHLPSIIFHTLVAILLFLLLKGVFSQELAFLSALFFGIHPVHTEAVTYIAGRADPLAALFILLSIFLFNKNLIFSMFAFILAILSKESGLVTPFLIILYSLFTKGTLKEDLRKIAPFLVILVIYSILRMTVLNFSHTISESIPKPFFYIPFHIRLLTFLKTLPIYFGILLWPIHLHMERNVDLSYSILEPQTAVGIIIFITLFILGYSIRKKNKVLLFSATWFFVAIFPNSNIVPINALIYEHWLYLPSIGFFIMLGWVMGNLLKKEGISRIFSIILITSLVFFYSYRTIQRNKDWRNPIAFYESTIRYKSGSARLHNNLAMAYSDEGRDEDAIREYEKAIEIGDHYPQPHHNLANIYIKRNNIILAIKELERSLEIDNNFLYSHEKLAIIYFNQNRFSEAKKEALFILEREPENRIGLEILRKISQKDRT